MTRRPLLRAVMAVIALWAAWGCSRTPEYVIPKDSMAELLADLYMAEAYIDNNGLSFSTDSMKLALRESVYRRHGVDAQRVDTSFMWYGHNIEDYMEVCDRTIAILEQRMGQTPDASRFNIDPAGGAPRPVAAVDSTDLWMGPRTVTIDPRSPSRIIPFDIPLSEAGDKPGSAYSLRMKIDVNPVPATLFMMVDYADASTEIITSEKLQNDWLRSTLVTDSTRVPTRLYGHVALVDDSAPTRIDSISLWRKNADSRMYQRRYRQEHFSLPQP